MNNVTPFLATLFKTTGDRPKYRRFYLGSAGPQIPHRYHDSSAFSLDGAYYTWGGATAVVQDRAELMMKTVRNVGVGDGSAPPLTPRSKHLSICRACSHVAGHLPMAS